MKMIIYEMDLRVYLFVKYDVIQTQYSIFDIYILLSRSLLKVSSILMQWYYIFVFNMPSFAVEHSVCICHFHFDAVFLVAKSIDKNALFLFFDNGKQRIGLKHGRRCILYCLFIRALTFRITIECGFYTTYVRNYLHVQTDTFLDEITA